MSDSLPFEIQVEIINRLPVKSLIQFRSVCKSWKSLIDSSGFIAGYSSQHTQPQHLLVRFNEHSYKRKYISIVDDDTFPQQKVSLTLPLLVNMLNFSGIIGSSHGLFCLYGFEKNGLDDDPFSRRYMVVLWNASIRKAVAVVVPNVGDGLFRSVIGFGICRETIDPKIVKINHIRSSNDMESISCIPLQVEVFTLSTGAWNSPCGNLPRKSIDFNLCSVAIDGFLYWLATDVTNGTGAFSYYNLIVSFDMTNEEFREVNLPDSLARHKSNENLNIYKLRKSLVVIESNEEEEVFVVWMMEDYASKSLTKLFTIYAPDAIVYLVLEFRKSGEPIIELEHHCAPHDGSSLGVYEPNSKHISNIEINGNGSYCVFAYKETLLLLDQPDFIIYDNGKLDILKQRAKHRRLLKHTSKKHRRKQ